MLCIGSNIDFVVFSIAYCYSIWTEDFFDVAVVDDSACLQLRVDEGFIDVDLESTSLE